MTNDFDIDKAAAALYGSNQTATTTEDPVAARERDAASVLYGTAPGGESIVERVRQSPEEKSIAGQAEDPPRAPEETLYGNDGEKHVADLYYRGLRENAQQLAALDEDGADAAQVHRDLAQGLHSLNVSDTAARSMIDDVVRSAHQDETDAQYAARQTDLADFLSKQDASFKQDMADAGALLEATWGERGREWAAYIEAHATPQLLMKVRDAVQSHRRAKRGF